MFETGIYHSQIDGFALHTRHYPCLDAKAFVFILHGMGDHQARFEYIANMLQTHGFEVASMDYRGHGLSLFADTLPGHFADDDGLKKNIQDIHAVIQQLNKDKRKLVLLGHSMGSLFARFYLKNYPSDLDLLVLTGSPSDNPKLKLAKPALKVMKTFVSKRKPSKLFAGILNQDFLKHIKQPTTKLDWISHNPENVQAYLADPLCGFPLTLQGYEDLFSLVAEVYAPEQWTITQPQLPILFESGADDVCQLPFGVPAAAENLRNKGYTNVSWNLIENTRHELFQEATKDATIKQIIDWIELSLKQ